MIKNIIDKIKQNLKKVNKKTALIALGGVAVIVAAILAWPSIESNTLGYSVVTGYEKNIRASVTAVQTTIPVTSLELKDGTTLDINMLGGKVFLTLEPGSATREEIVMCEGINTTTISFTTCTRGLSFSGTSTAAVTANQKTHSAGSKLVMSNVHYVYEQYADVNNKDQTLAGNKTWTGTTLFYGFPVVSSTGYTGLPSQYGQLATKYYVDAVGAGGFTSLNVSTTRGLSVDGSAPEMVGINASSTTGMGFDSSGSLFQDIGSALVYVANKIQITVASLISGGVATTTPTAGLIPIASSTGRLADGWQNITLANVTDLTDSGTTTLHYHDGRFASSSATVQATTSVSVGTAEASYTEVRSATAGLTGSMSINWGCSNIGNTARSRLYVNGVAVSGEVNCYGGATSTYTHTTIKAGDRISIYAYQTSGALTYVTYFWIGYDVVNRSDNTYIN